MTEASNFAARSFIFGGYGMSETGPVLTLAQLNADEAPPDDPDRMEIRCKAGRPLPLVDLKVVDSELNEVPRDGASTGEVWYAPPGSRRAISRIPSVRRNSGRADICTPAISVTWTQRAISRSSTS